MTNNGKNAVYNVEAWSHDFSRYIGTLKPGQTRKYTYMQYIPTDEDLAEWFGGSNVKLTGSLDVESIILTFKDDNGVIRACFNHISIKLLN